MNIYYLGFFFPKKKMQFHCLVIKSIFIATKHLLSIKMREAGDRPCGSLQGPSLLGVGRRAHPCCSLSSVTASAWAGTQEGTPTPQASRGWAPQHGNSPSPTSLGPTPGTPGLSAGLGLPGLLQAHGCSDVPAGLSQPHSA